MKYHFTLFLVLFTTHAFGVAEMKLKCEGHTMFKKKVCEIEVSVNTESQDQNGNLQGQGSLKCYERGGTIINQSFLKSFCYTGSGDANGTFLLEAQTEIKPFEVPSMKASVTIDISASSKKMAGNANYYNGSVFKDMAIKCEYVQ